jgi:hypothetical protein
MDTLRYRPLRCMTATLQDRRDILHDGFKNHSGNTCEEMTAAL